MIGDWVICDELWMMGNMNDMNDGWWKMSGRCLVIDDGWWVIGNGLLVIGNG